MTKQEKIKEAYNGLESKMIDDYGWTFTRQDHYGECGIEPYGEYETRNHSDDYYEWRPKSLIGIENNNGWIKIETEEDLPKEKGHYFVKYSNDFIDICFYKTEILDINFWKKNYTHYMPIEIPKLPVY